MLPIFEQSFVEISKSNFDKFYRKQKKKNFIHNFIPGFRNILAVFKKKKKKKHPINSNEFWSESVKQAWTYIRFVYTNSLHFDWHIKSRIFFE